MRDYSKFFTPDEHADFMVDWLNLKVGDAGFDPSAGNGQLVRAVRRKHGDTVIINAIELNKEYEDDLQCADNLWLQDFLDHRDSGEYDFCIANPPFGNGIDLLAHVEHMREMTKLGGKIVMIVPADFNPKCSFSFKKIDNYSSNSDGTTTPIKMIMFTNY